MTNKTKHTPGKWQVHERFPHCYAIANCDEHGVRKSIAWLGQSTNKSNEENLANARLIACAPELLEALEDVIDSWCKKYCGVRAFIAKKEGCGQCWVRKHVELVNRAKGAKEA